MISFRPTRLCQNLALFVLLLLFVGCASPLGDGPYFGKVQPPEGQVLRYISGSEPTTLDPQQMVLQGESRIAVALFDGLVEFEEATAGQRLSLAKRLTSDSSRTIWTFHLRDDAKWSDNTPLTAHDFIYSWQRALSPELAARNASLMYIIKNAEQYNAEMAFVRDPTNGKYATERDLERAKGQQEISFTGSEPERFDQATPAQSVNKKLEQNSPQEEISETQVKDTRAAQYLYVPGDEKKRDQKIKKDAELARFVAGKNFVKVEKGYVGVRALDDYTFQVTLKGPTANFVNRLSHPFFRPVPRQAIEKFGDDLWTRKNNIVTSGAFKLEDWRPFEMIVVVRNPVFWDNQNTKLDKIVFPAIAKPATAMNLYKAGEVDAMGTGKVLAAWRNELHAHKKDYMSGPYLQIEALGIKTTLPPLDKVHVRKALSMAINRQDIAALAPGRVPTTSFVPKLPGYENANVEGFNPKKAQDLMAEAGYPNGQGFPELEILFNDDSDPSVQEFIQQSWNDVLHIHVELIKATTSEWTRAINKKRLAFKGFARWSNVADYADPYVFLEQARIDSDYNCTGWKDPTYDGMLDTANRETDTFERLKLLHAAEEYLMSQQPMIPLYLEPNAFMKKPYVKNLDPNLLDQHDWRQVYIDHSMTAEKRDFDTFEPWQCSFFAFLNP